MAYVRTIERLSRANTNRRSVGLKVTSLKWIGPEPEESESIPQIPAQIEYTDAVTRGEDIGIEDDENKLPSSQSEGILVAVSLILCKSR